MSINENEKDDFVPSKVDITSVGYSETLSENIDDIVKPELTEDVMNEKMMEQNEKLLKELEKTKAENEKLKGKEETPKEESFQEMMIRKAREIDAKPITEGMRAHAFSHQGTLAVGNLDPNKHYRFVSKMNDKLKVPDARNAAQRKQDGYVVTSDPDGKLIGPRATGGSNIETHDLILMETSKENAADRAMIPVIKAKAAITAVKNDAANQGIEGKIAGEKKEYADDLQMMSDTDTIKVSNIF